MTSPEEFVCVRVVVVTVCQHVLAKGKALVKPLKPS